MQPLRLHTRRCTVAECGHENSCRDTRALPSAGSRSRTAGQRGQSQNQQPPKCRSCCSTPSAPVRVAGCHASAVPSLSFCVIHSLDPHADKFLLAPGTDCVPPSAAREPGQAPRTVTKPASSHQRPDHAANNESNKYAGSWSIC